MNSIKHIFKIGPGPSSSHTIAPYKAILDFAKRSNKFDSIEVTLRGSLALTGKGHGTDKILEKALANIKVKVVFDYNLNDLIHPNTMQLSSFLNNKLVDKQTYFSLGGGDISIGKPLLINENIYPFSSFNEIKMKIKDGEFSNIPELVNKYEKDGIDDYLAKMFLGMVDEIENGLKAEGYLPGSLKIKRVAKCIYDNAQNIKDDYEKKIMLLTSFAYAASESNANGEKVVTAPTCGSCGVLSSVLYYEYKYEGKDIKQIIDSLKVSGIIGNLIKTNASVSGALHGCQAEIGSASAMASAALAFLNGLSIYQIEYASELALEHFLGLTCDPVEGYVQIPCIERNGIGSIRALIAYIYARDIAPIRQNKVSFDDVVTTMRITGESLSKEYKETSIGGLAKVLSKKGS